MSQCHVSSKTKYQRVSNAVSAGTTDVDSTAVDLTAAESVTFLVLLGALTSTNVTTAKLQESDDNSTFTDVTGGTASDTVDDDDNQILVLEYLRAKKRYVRVKLTRATANAVVDGIVAEIHGLRNSPPTNGATVHSVTQAVGY